MYEFILSTHNIIRWLLLPLLILVTFMSWMAVSQKRSFNRTDNLLGAIMVGMAHLQLLLGLSLLFISPAIQQATQDFGAAMKDAPVRKILIEHPLMAIIAVVLLQLGRSFSKKASSALKKHKTVAIYTTIALILILSRIPNWNLF